MNVTIGFGWQQQGEASRQFFESVVHVDPFRHIGFQEAVGPQEVTGPTGRDLARVLHYHHSGDRARFYAYEELVKKVIPDIRLVEAPIVGGAQTTASVRFINDPLSYTLQQLSSGVKDVLLLIAAAFFSRPGSLILIEEPENHLHPSAQKALIAVFREIVASDQKQILLTTHSETIARQFEPDAVLFVDRHRTAERVVPLSKVDVYTAWEQLGVDRGSLLQVLGRSEQVVVVVEGRDDYETLEPVWRHAGLSERVLQVRAEGGGFREVVECAKQLRDGLARFRLPSRVFVILDSDRDRDAKVANLRDQGFSDETSHVWAEQEIESYIILPSTLVAISGRPRGEVERAISEARGGGKERFEHILARLNMRRLPKSVLMQNALSVAPNEVPAELLTVAEKVRRLLGLRSS